VSQAPRKRVACSASFLAASPWVTFQERVSAAVKSGNRRQLTLRFGRTSRRDTDLTPRASSGISEQALAASTPSIRCADPRSARASDWMGGPRISSELAKSHDGLAPLVSFSIQASRAPGRRISGANVTSEWSTKWTKLFHAKLPGETLLLHAGRAAITPSTRRDHYDARRPARIRSRRCPRSQRPHRDSRANYSRWQRRAVTLRSSTPHKELPGETRLRAHCLVGAALTALAMKCASRLP
jgi:hypothetical protein